MRPGPDPNAVENVNGAPQLPSAPVRLVGQDRNQPNPQARQHQQHDQDDNWARPPPHPSDRRALTPITERSTRESNYWDTNTNPHPLQRPGISTANGSPLQPDQIQKQLSETSQDLPKLQTDTESTTFLGEAVVTSPTSHIPLQEFGIDRDDSPGSLDSKLDPHQSKQDSLTLSRPDSKLDTHGSTDQIHPNGSVGSPLSSPGKESVFSALPSPHSHQLVHPMQSVFSDIPKTPPRSPDRPAFRKGFGVESGSPVPNLPSRFQGAIQRKEGSSPSNALPVATKVKTPEATSLSQTDPHPNSPAFSPTPTTANSVPTLAHTTTTTSASKSEYSDGSNQSSSQNAQGTLPSPDYLNQHSHSSHPKGTVQSETFQKGSLSTGSVEGVKHLRKVNEGKEADDHDLIKEAGALYYIQELQGTTVQPPKVVGRGQSPRIRSKGHSESDDDEGERELFTQDAPRPLPRYIQTRSQPQQHLPPEPSPLQLKRPAAQAKPSFLPPPPPPPHVSPPQHSTQPSPYPSQTQYQDQGYAQGREQQPILAPQPQQPVTSSFNPVKTMEGDVRSPDPHHPDSDTNNNSPVVDSRRISVIVSGSGGGQGVGSRPGLVSRPSGARDPVLKQRAGTSDSVSSHFHHNGQPQPRHPLPPHPESPSEQPSQSSYATHTQFSHHQGQDFTQSPGDTTQTPQSTNTANRYPVIMQNVDQHQHYDDNSDALAALTFLERDEANASLKPSPRATLQDRAGPTSGPKANTHDTPPVQITPSESRDDVSQDSGSYEGKFKSSFAPSNQATRRLANTQAQRAAHQAAVHRPGKSGSANGKGKKRVRQGGWAESSDEEEEEDEDEDDEDVDSDGDPVTQRRGQGSGSGPGQNLGKLSTQNSPYGSSTDLNQPGQAKPQRHLPRPPSPGRGYGTSVLSKPSFLSQFCFILIFFSCRRSGRVLPSPRA